LVVGRKDLELTPDILSALASSGGGIQGPLVDLVGNRKPSTIQGCLGHGHISKEVDDFVGIPAAA
jgi:hypothetical protein